MADKYIRKDFIEGMHEVFTTLFNDGSEYTDGIFLYLLSDKVTTNVYGERKSKTYQAPKLLVSNAHLSPTQGEETVEGIKDHATFKVTLKTLMDNDLGVTKEDLDTMRKAKIKFHDKFYTVDNISPTTYVEDTFLFYTFECTEDIGMTSIDVEE